MKLIGAGLGGTGTLQAKAALELLGAGPCYHIAEVAEHPEHVPLWQALADDRTVDWEDIFAGYASCVDFPACAFYAELTDAYPQARVLLTVREPDRAYDRVRDTIYTLSTAADSPLPDALKRALDGIVWQGVFAGAFEDRELTLDVYRRWPEEVASRVPADRLLVYDVGEGWEPLCRFLAVEVPDTPFPH
jgi:hypothetical protein